MYQHSLLQKWLVLRLSWISNLGQSLAKTTAKFWTKRTLNTAVRRKTSKTRTAKRTMIRTKTWRVRRKRSRLRSKLEQGLLNLSLLSKRESSKGTILSLSSRKSRESISLLSKILAKIKGESHKVGAGESKHV